MITVQSREEFLNELNKHLPKDCYAIELGVLYGDFSKMILDIINPLVLVLVDPYRIGEKKYLGSLDYLSTEYSNEDQYQNIVRKFETEILSGQVEILRKTSFEAVKDVYLKYDFSYHDSSHLYEDIKKELNEWLPKVKPDGLICGHDYMDFEGFGVKQAVNEFITEHDFEMIIYNENGGDWALKRKQI